MEMSKFDIEKYDDKTDFVLWQMHMTVILFSLGIKCATYGRDKLVEVVTNKK